MEHVIDRLGGPGVIARICAVSSPSVTNWRRRGIPIERCVQIEQATKGAAMRWDLRPQDWHRIWPELLARPDAPPLPASSVEPRLAEAAPAPASAPVQASGGNATAQVAA